MLNKIKFLTFFFIVVFPACSCSNVDFNVKDFELEPPKSNSSSIFPTNTFIKIETHLEEKGKPTRIVSTCSGFAVKHTKDGTIGITNSHCTEKNPGLITTLFINHDIKLKYKVKLPTNETIEVKLLKHDSSVDLSSFLIPNVYINTVKLSKIEPEQGEEIFIIGTPVGWENFSSGFDTVPIIRGLFNGKTKVGRLQDRTGYLYSARIAPGSSGSAVFVRRNNTFHVIGVVHSIIVLDSGLGLYKELCVGTTLTDLQKFLAKST